MHLEHDYASNEKCSTCLLRDPVIEMEYTIQCMQVDVGGNHTGLEGQRLPEYVLREDL